MLAALRAVGATALAIATPYVDALNAIERRFFVDSGFLVAAIAGLGCTTDRAIGRLGPTDAEALATRVDTAAADAIFVSCTNFHCLEAVAGLEAARGKPVVRATRPGPGRRCAGSVSTTRSPGTVDSSLKGRRALRSRRL